MNRNSLILAHVMLAALAASSFAQTEPASSQALPAASAPPVSAKAASSTEGSAAAIQTTSTAPTQHGPVSFRRDGLWFSTADGSTHLQVHGYAQADNRMFSSNTHGQELDTFLFRRIRPLFEGTLFNQVDFTRFVDAGIAPAERNTAKFDVMFDDS